MHSYLVKADAAGKIIRAGSGGFWGFAVQPALQWPYYPGLGTGDRPEVEPYDSVGSYPLRAILRPSGSTLEIQSGEAFYFDSQQAEVDLEGAEQNEVFRVVLLQKGEAFSQSQQRQLRAFWHHVTAYDTSPDDPTDQSDGYAIRPSWVGMNIGNVSAGLKFWLMTSWGQWQLQETLDVGIHYRDILSRCGRFYFSRAAGSEAPQLEIIAEVG